MCPPVPSCCFCHPLHDRLPTDKRRAYCRLVLALYEGNTEAAGQALKSAGYVSNQTGRAPERDAEFFEYIFRDAKVQKSCATCEMNSFIMSNELFL